MREQAAPKMCQPVFLLESYFLSMLQSGEKRLWNSLIRLLPFCRLSLLPSARALVFGGVVNLMEGYGNDNPGAKSQGMKQLMSGGGVILIGTQLIPLLSGLFG